MSRVPHLLVVAGGTGGHVYPALAVANQLRKQGVAVSWLGTHRGLESRVVPAHNIPMHWVSVEGLRGKGALTLLLAPFKLARAMWQSMRVIRRVKPDCVLGMGGFVAGPGGLMARLMGRPLIVHEQNAVAGLTNKYLAKIASRVLTGFPQVQGLPGTADWVGNPVRETIKPSIDGQTESRTKLRVLVVGGSQGAYSFNTKLPAVVSALSEMNIDIWHQSGRGNSAEVTANYAAQGVPARVTEFIDDMAEAYRWADMLICRAGAMTVAECCAAGKPALLIPYPFSAGDHQVKNAEAMVATGGARMLLNQQIEQPEMIATLQDMLSSRDSLRAMGLQAQSLHKPDALRDVVAVCQEYLDA
ncbi:UDP-N-acetylglucosamine--N-acetylmuramyl-(pentapeptide) pyrophosphoryl-undecaprenol N-acetylglucosamine transferase [Arenicella chitinivorans]|uniref:UDP-N-acetylglucosamine--N-acetylmuramyl-(pentapeptide) pyrophosphoryl-undecaprenol N-acetylglucosamine transferase n=1 Tax=Arenicella chitinivorans TaxID=1329800 RepID=A0A918RNY1_9GAMM|nr:undecaprenyldiphospho-muramoylpentapeptide beta-N-acetylglucosaminyltransferase [Arenicella chitinivorans]GHA05872.1 UDP-N-acetylglucosamine--N-acetylmuramyl-(pentapeptide) pyrophosphoryl-undecaprenol N-acetylglucosamine transferase [Arenicella chitinivorans]